MSNIVKVVGQIVGRGSITLYTEDGKTIELSSNSYRTQKLIEEITPILALHKTAEVDLDNYVATAAVEKKSGGLIRFFRVAKDKVKSILGASTDRGLSDNHHAGMISHPVADAVAPQPGTPPVTPEQVAALESANNALSGEGTLVAVVGDTPIVGAEALEAHIEAAASGDATGLTRFMELLAEVVRERKHTAQELLDFLKLADLPIADDGMIVGYKALKVHEEGEQCIFVDHHTGRVQQKVGSRVEMDVERVDDNRRVLCSNGLHIARRKYLTSYGSHGIVTLVKIDPRDVISVPLGEPDKMRVAAYHIVAKLPSEAHRFIRSNAPMTQNPDVAKLLGNVVKGNHAGHYDTVHIGKGNKVTTTKVGEEREVVLDDTVKARVMDDVEKVESVSPASINKQVDEIITTDKTLKAAMAGDLGAAVTEPAPKPKAKSKAKAKAAPKKPAKTEKPAAPAKDKERLEAEKKALKLVKGGASMREAERKTGVSARSIKRLLDAA